MEYFNIQPLMGYGAGIYIIVGARETGKSFNVKLWNLNRFFKHGEKFAFLFRRESQIKRAGQLRLFADIEREYPDLIDEYKERRNFIFVNNQEVSTLLFLRFEQNYKLAPFVQEFTHVIFDEFMDSNGDYLPNEFEALINLYNTIDRGRGITVFFLLSNDYTAYNPYYLGLHVTQPPKPGETQTYTTLADTTATPIKIVVHHSALINPNNIAISSNQLDFNAGTRYINDSTTLLEPRSCNAADICTLYLSPDKWVNVVWGINGVMYVEKRKTMTNTIYVADTAYLDIGTMDFRSEKLQKIKRLYYKGGVRFVDGISKLIGEEFLQLIR